MLASFVLLFKFLIDIIKHLLRDTYFKSLAVVMFMILIAGTLFYWLAQGRSILQAFAFAASTMAMNSPYGIEWGPTTYAGVIFHVIYTFISVGIFLLFVLETGKTMVKTYEDFKLKMAERKTRK